jgi:hypothetical protein
LSVATPGFGLANNARFVVDGAGFTTAGLRERGAVFYFTLG